MDRRASPDGVPYGDRAALARHALGPLRLTYYNKTEGLAALEGEHLTIMVYWSAACRDPGTLTRLLSEAPALYDLLQELALAARQVLREPPPRQRQGLERLRERVSQAAALLARVRARPRGLLLKSGRPAYNPPVAPASQAQEVPPCRKDAG